ASRNAIRRPGHEVRRRSPGRRTHRRRLCRSGWRGAFPLGEGWRSDLPGSRRGSHWHQGPAVVAHVHLRRNVLILSTLLLLALLAWSGWHPYDRPTWLLEVMPILVAVPVLWATWRRFPLTTL